MQPPQIAAQRSKTAFSKVFALELLKSQRQKSLFLASLIAIGTVIALAMMVSGREHFERLGDSEGRRYWIALLAVVFIGYELTCAYALQRFIRANRLDGPPYMGSINAFLEPTFPTIGLLLERLVFSGGAFFNSPLFYAYPLMILLSSLRLSWQICLLTSFVAAAEYLTLIIWHWLSTGQDFGTQLLATFPIHGMRAALFILTGVAAGFIAQQIRAGIGKALKTVEERDFIASIFGRYVTEDVAEVLLKSPDALQIGGEKRTVTLIMTDLRGFTTISECLSPEAVVAMLNHYLSCMIDIIIQYGGTIDEFIGDAILAIFGAPLSRGNDVERAVACALEMQRAMEAVNQWNAEQGYPNLEMGIGIHTGPVVVGNIGSEKRSKYGVIGSTANLTSRIESLTVGGQVLISSETAAAIAPQLKVGHQWTVELKGIATPVEIFEVVGIQGTYVVDLPRKGSQRHLLDPPLPVEFIILAGKTISGPVYQGYLTELSEKEAKLETDCNLDPLCNLRIQLFPKGEASLPDYLLAKNLGQVEQGYELRFTAKEPESAAYLRAFFNQNRAGQTG